MDIILLDLLIMLAKKTLTEFTNFFSRNNFNKKWWYNSKLFYDKCLKMTECNSYETHNIYPNLGVPLSNQQQLRLNKIMKLKIVLLMRLKKEN